MGELLASRADVARLLGRAAFGATNTDLNRWEGAPYSEIVDHLLTVPANGSQDYDRVLAELTTSPVEGQLWWLNRMLTTKYPLEERMTLFWHDHFATSWPKARGDEMVVQNATIRNNALGNFRQLAYDMTIDPAMLKWLDGRLNVGSAPNENYAREFFELFTLGTHPKVYTERDIREAARALTGWTTNGLIGELQAAQFQAGNHDAGTKVILGASFPNLGPEEYKRVVDIALAQPIAPRFVAYKLVQHFAYQPTSPDLATSPDPLVDQVAVALATSNWDIKAGVRTLLMSDAFRYPDPVAGKQVVRQPIEILIHATKTLGLPLIVDTGVINELRNAGQAPFEPPNVGGWPLGKAWLSPTGFLGRYAVGARAVQIRNGLDALHLLMPSPPSADIRSGGHRWAAYMGLDALSPNTLATVHSFVSSGDGGNEINLQDGIFLLIANSPDWQVM